MDIKWKNERLKKCILNSVIIILFISCSKSNTSEQNLEINAIEVSPNQFKVLFENEFVRVIEYNLKPGEKDLWHTHPKKTSYVISGGKLEIRTEEGEEFTVVGEKGNASWMDAVGKHYAENIGDSTVRILLTEIK